MFSAYFLTCMLSMGGKTECNVSYTEMPETIVVQDQCDMVVELMHQRVIDQVATEHPTLTISKVKHGCYPGLLSGSEVALDEHAKLLNHGISSSLSEIP